MDKAHIIAHTKMYMDLLVQGIDPISKQRITEDSVVLQERMKKCFAFVSEVFGEMLENNGFVALTEQDARRCRVVVSKAEFSLSEQQIHEISVSTKPISPNEFLRRINKVVDEQSMEKLSARSVNAWLVSQGYLVESKFPVTINRTARRPSDKAAGIGIREEETVDPQTGETKRQMMLSLQAQAYLLEHLEEIARCK